MMKFQVDFMLGSYMEDIGITPEQFEAACGVASKKIKYAGSFKTSESRG